MTKFVNSPRLSASTSAVALGVALILAAPTAAFAQDADAAAAPSDEDAIVVTGIRGSIQNSVNIKKNSTSIVEAISAEDIGKLPDVSIAESLSRLPGLATQRLDGRANVISIRGLAPDFTTTLLNGREQVSANNNRGVELDQYPSELLNGAVVYKTPDASLIGQAMGGTIDMKTVRPLAYGKRALAFGARFEMNDLGKLNPDISNKGYRANVTYIDQNAAGTLGWALGYARMSSPTQEERFAAWGYPDLNATTKVIGGVKPYVKSNKLNRDAVMGVLEFEPSDAFHTTIDAYYSQFKDDQRLRGIEIPLQWSDAVLQPGYTVSDGLVSAGSFSNVGVVQRNDVVHRNAKIYSIGINQQFKPSDTLTIEADASYSKIKKTEENIEIYTGTGRGPLGATDTLGFTIADTGVITFTPGLNYADPNLFRITDPRGWNSCGSATTPNCQDGFINVPTVRDNLKSLRLQATQEMEGFVSSIRIGANYTVRTKQLVDKGYVLTHKAWPADSVVPSDYLLDPVNLGFIGMGNSLAFDSWRYYNDGNYTLTDEGLWETSRHTRSWKIREKVTTGFLQVNYDDDIGGAPIRGNIGLQVVHTKQSAGGFAVRNNNGTLVVDPVTRGASYTDILPSWNMSIEMSPQTFLRFGAARILARPRMDKLNPGLSYNFNTTNAAGTTLLNSPWSGGGGNPELRPLYADTVDLAVEKYWGKGTYLALGGFYKYIENYPYDATGVFDFTGIPAPTGFNPTYFLGTISQPQNGGGGRVYGAELSGGLNFGYGFGSLFSASYTKSNVREGLSAPIEMPGLSKWVANGTLFYENHGLQARVSGRYRSKFLGEVYGLSLRRETVSVKDEFVVDAQLGYEFQSGGLKGLSILLQGQNLTNEPFITYYNGDERQVKDYQNYGRNFMLGFNYKF